MKKSALMALLVAIMLPLTGYFIVKYYSKTAVQMPRHYFYDTVIVKNINSEKTVYDTVWHKIKSINFTNQFGKNVSLNDLHGKIIVLDFFFSRCPVVCPGLTRGMKKLQDSFKKNDSIVQFVSISINPEYDSVNKLRKFADRFNINHDNWWFLTGNKDSIYNFSIKEIKANIADPKVDTAFIHTENFFLIDTNKIIRGFYNGLDSLKLAKLAHDIPTLMLEKDKNSKSIFRTFIPILPLIFFGIGIVLLVTILLNKNRNK